MSDYREIRYEVEDQIATVTFNRPEHRNPISVDMLGEVASAVRAAQRDDGVRVLVITGAGRAFCSGGDVKSMAEVTSVGGGALSARQEQVGLIQETQLLLRRFPKVLIAAVNGAAYGAGLDLACAADWMAAAASSTSGAAHPGRGRVEHSDRFGVNSKIGVGEHRGGPAGLIRPWAPSPFVRPGLGIGPRVFKATDPSVHSGPILVFTSDRSKRSRWTETRTDLTPELLRSELFGHERGAFTGAVGK